MPDNTEEVLQDANAVAVGRTIHPEATGMLQVDRSIELFGVSQGSVGFRAPATAHGPIYTLPASDGTAGDVLTTDGASNLYWTTPGTITTTIGASLGLVGSDLSVNERAFTWAPFAGTITEVVLLATPSGSAAIGIWATGYASWPPTGSNSITGTSPASVVSGVKYKDTTLSTWTTTFASDTCFLFNVDYIASVQQVTCVLKITRTATSASGQSAGGDGGVGLVHSGDSSGGRPYGGDYGGPAECNP